MKSNQVNPNALNSKLSEELSKIEELAPPAWVGVVKSGPHVERTPHQKDFWYKRCASLLRKMYFGDRVGVSKLRKVYGGRKNRGSKPEHKIRAGGSTIRKALQALEKTGFAKKGAKGREITGKGRSFLEKAVKSMQ